MSAVSDRPLLSSRMSLNLKNGASFGARSVTHNVTYSDCEMSGEIGGGILAKPLAPVERMRCLRCSIAVILTDSLDMGLFTREDESLRFVERGLERSKTAASTLLTPAGEKRFQNELFQIIERIVCEHVVTEVQ
eukprot:CAMPEP_0179408434 /NCGR_PEP_ID=MMETSP0799-20121207/2087_1 /TAXON_ID=46947 /ORGANISM="Geminigera cryophila, Strain CCMP2564" /LENGTH=133 /DNA_ID=CAMNT_0021179887 /DNA_START=135 /DNA_END=536 /DNA_ORIENTATION=+